MLLSLLLLALLTFSENSQKKEIHDQVIEQYKKIHNFCNFYVNSNTPGYWGWEKFSKKTFRFSSAFYSPTTFTTDFMLRPAVVNTYSAQLTVSVHCLSPGTFSQTSYVRSSLSDANSHSVYYLVLHPFTLGSAGNAHKNYI